MQNSCLIFETDGYLLGSAEGRKEHMSCTPERWEEEAGRQSQQQTTSHLSRAEHRHPTHFLASLYPWPCGPSRGCRQPFRWPLPWPGTPSGSGAALLPGQEAESRRDGEDSQRGQHVTGLVRSAYNVACITLAPVDSTPGTGAWERLQGRGLVVRATQADARHGVGSPATAAPAADPAGGAPGDSDRGFPRPSGLWCLPGGSTRSAPRSA